MAELTDPDAGVPPPTEQIHLPDPSYQPVLVALGITLAVVGVVLNWVLFGIGILIFLIATFRWIRSARADMAELPLSQ